MNITPVLENGNMVFTIDPHGYSTGVHQFVVVAVKETSRCEKFLDNMATVIINEKPVANFEVSALTNGGILLNEGTVITLSPANLSLSYDLFINENLFAEINNESGEIFFELTITDLPTGLNTLSVTVENEAGCIATLNDAVTFCSLDAEPISLAQDVNGNGVLAPGNYFVENNIEIFATERLTLGADTELYFQPGVSVIVNPSAKLFITNSTLTNKCGEQWDGIIVLGDEEAIQSERLQGVVELNAATIENADIGVRAWGASSWTGTGGIVKAQNSIFRNVRVGISLATYRPAYSKSFVRECTFEITDNSPTTINPRAFIYLLNIDGVSMWGNTFTNLTGNGKGKGILTNNASYNVLGICDGYPLGSCPDGANLTPNLFSGLYYGIDSRNKGTADIAKIRNNEFTDCGFGIYLHGNQGAILTGNKFTHCSEAGLYMKTSTGFQIEGNTYHRNIAGIYLYDCKGANELYKNCFGDPMDDTQGNDYGIVTEGGYTGLPQRADGYIGVYSGVQFICNEFHYNGEHIHINTKGASVWQGSPELTAGNVFYPNCEVLTGRGQLHIPFEIVQGSTVNDFINYYSQLGPEFEPDCSSYQSVAIHTISEANHSCPDRIDAQSGGGSVFAANVVVLEDKIRTIEIQILELTDGGDTPTLLNEVVNANHGQLIKLRNMLLHESPQLSDTVMAHTVNRYDILPVVMLKQMLVANPRSAKSSQIRAALKRRSHQIPKPMMEEIMEGMHTLSELEILNDKRNAAEQERNLLINKEMRLLAQDTVSYTALTEIISLAEAENTVERIYEATAASISKNDIAKAEIILSGVGDLELSDAQQVEFNELLSIMEIRLQLASENKNWKELTEEQMAVIVSLSENSKNRAGSQAIAIRSIIEEFGYVPEVIIRYTPEEESKSRANGEIVFSEFLASPNPAKEYFIVEYTLSGKETVENTQIKLFNQNGDEIIDFELKHNTDQLLVECESIKPGTYFLRKINYGEVTAKQTVVILGEGEYLKNNTTSFGSVLLEIYPNPAESFFTVNCFVPKNSETSVFKLKDITRKTVFEKMVNPNETSFEVDIRKLASGMYFATYAGKTIKVAVNK